VQADKRGTARDKALRLQALRYQVVRTVLFLSVVSRKSPPLLSGRVNEGCARVRANVFGDVENLPLIRPVGTLPGSSERGDGDARRRGWTAPMAQSAEGRNEQYAVAYFCPENEF
jgi:hypothetical protein